MRRPAGKAALGAGLMLTLIGAGIPAAAAGDRPVHRAAASAGCPTTVPGTDPLPAPTMTATRIRGGFHFLEGPVWDAASGSLLFTELQNAAGPQRVQPSAIRRFTPPATFATFVENAGSNGLAITPDGTEILAATHDQRSVSSYRLADRARAVLAREYRGAQFNSPNDLTVRGDGTVYFTDPNFQRGGRPDQLGGTTGVYRVRHSRAGAGTVSLVDAGVAQPNGIVLSPDEKTLYVGGNAGNRIFRYQVLSDGSTGPRTDFAALRGPDGATVDCAGNVYWASYNDGRVHVFDPAGRQLGTIAAGRNTTNVAFGGADRRTLFVTSGTTGDFGLYSVRLNVPGNPF